MSAQNIPFIILGTLIALILASGLMLAMAWARGRFKPSQPALVCPQCKQAWPSGAVQCPHCGWRQTPTPPATKVESGQLSTPKLPTPQTPYLLAVGRTLDGQQFYVPTAPRGLTLGRNADNDVVLDSIMASRFHAQVMPEGAQFVLYDRESTNGTYVNDQRVYRHVLAPGDRVQIGDCQFTFVVPGQREAPPPTPGGGGLLQYPPYTVFEGFLLLELLGHGGMSVVYKAQDAAGQVVAIKILDVTDQWVARKFVQEGKIGAALQGHPHIRAVRDVQYGRDQRPYLVMEYVEGTSLRPHIGAPMPPTQIVALMGQVCEAVDFAHQHNVVHRDIKPENVLLSHDGLVKVTDFGIAKLTSSVTVTKDRIVGTPEYISPEQARGEEQVKPASDIYSLGVVLYEMLTGRVPFPLSKDKERYQAAYTVIGQHINETPQQPSRLSASVTPQLERAAMRALEKEPGKRFATAAEMARALGYDRSMVLHLPATPAAMQLVVVEGPAQGKTILLAESDVEIGREQLDPDNLQISRRHAVLSRRGQAWWLQDVSRNGTWVNGQRIYDQVPLDDKARIEIGGNTLCLAPRREAG